jgi:Endonuclease/Exonuclease/phosphatase family
MGRKTNKSTGKKSKNKTSNKLKEQSLDANSWVNRLRFVTIENCLHHDKVDPQSTVVAVVPTTISILSWNVLAEAYCSRHSQVQLPTQFQRVVFNSVKRKARILEVLEQLCTDEWLDVVCLQEVDMPEIKEKMISLGYFDYVETPRIVGGGAGGRTDGCAVYVRNGSHHSSETKSAQRRDDAANKVPVDRCNSDDFGSVSGKVSSPMHWKMTDSEIVRLDDLATLSSAASSTDPNQTETQTQSASDKLKSSSYANIQGIQTSFLRRNMALIVRLCNTVTQETIIIANAHLYWNPGFEYVKVHLQKWYCFQVTFLPVSDFVIY